VEQSAVQCGNESGLPVVVALGLLCTTLEQQLRRCPTFLMDLAPSAVAQSASDVWCNRLLKTDTDSRTPPPNSRRRLSLGRMNCRYRPIPVCQRIKAQTVVTKRHNLEWYSPAKAKTIRPISPSLISLGIYGSNGDPLYKDAKPLRE
jgi:hypothetical protein